MTFTAPAVDVQAVTAVMETAVRRLRAAFERLAAALRDSARWLRALRVSRHRAESPCELAGRRRVAALLRIRQRRAARRRR